MLFGGANVLSAGSVICDQRCATIEDALKLRRAFRRPLRHNAAPLLPYGGGLQIQLLLSRAHVGLIRLQRSLRRLERLFRNVLVFSEQGLQPRVLLIRQPRLACVPFAVAPGSQHTYCETLPAPEPEARLPGT